MKLRRWQVAFAALVATCVYAHGQSRKEIYELQERCGKRAAEVFEKDFPKNERKGLEDFENHYSVRLNKCFLLEINTIFLTVEGKNVSSKSLVLVDINDNKSYGTFHTSFSCEVMEKACRTEQEFRALIRPYMED